MKNIVQFNLVLTYFTTLSLVYTEALNQNLFIEYAYLILHSLPFKFYIFSLFHLLFRNKKKNFIAVDNGSICPIIDKIMATCEAFRGLLLSIYSLYKLQIGVFNNLELAKKSFSFPLLLKTTNR